MIRFDRVYKAYSGAQDALKNISLEIDEGEFVFLTGHSGAGKSTLLRLIALIDRATHGQVIVDGRNLDRVPRRQIPYFRRHIGFIFQEHRLLPERSVFDNVALPLVVAGLRTAETQKRVRAALDKVGLLNKERASPRSLSSGEKSRGNLAQTVGGFAHAGARRFAQTVDLPGDEGTGFLDPVLHLFGQ